MIDDLPSATPMPAQPLATATNPVAPFPPVDSSPDFVPPSVMDPVSNLDFLPVDDAFALEMRAETIEQLVGGDALRRGVSERIEAGRSKTNADLVAGRDRVRVQDTLHEHTGHGLAEQAAHLHTTVDGRLDVLAASEDTVLLAGHMSDLWNGGAAIVAAMTDDTVGGGGIRVTTPLDLWVHGLMGVEERIGTCTADAVLLELGATHYEREYGPGAHAAGLAVYTGSLYQSSRSTFRPLMRASNGVRNLIAGGGDGSGSGGGDGGAGDASATTPPPPSAAGDSGTETASGTLRAATGTGGAGTRAASDTLCPVTSAGGTAQAGVMPGERSADLTGILQVDDVATLAREANVVGTSGNLTRLRRGEDTAGQLRALQDATRGDEADPESVVRSTSRDPVLVDTVPELDDTASVHEASAPNIETDIRSGPKVPGMDAPVSHSNVWPPQLPPGVKYGLPGGGDAPPRPAAPESDFRAVYRRLGELRERYSRRRNRIIVEACEGARERIFRELLYRFELFGGTPEELAQLAGDFDTEAEKVYFALHEMVHQAQRDHYIGRADLIREVLDAIRTKAIAEDNALFEVYILGGFPHNQAMQLPPVQLPPVTGGSPVTVASTSAALAGRLDIADPAHRIVPEVTLASPQPAGGLVHATDVPGPPPASSLPRPSLSDFEAADALASDLGRARLDQPATAAGQPTTTAANVTPALVGPSSFWLQPLDPWPTPGTGPVDSGLHHAGETVQPGNLGRGRLDPSAPATTAAQPIATAANVTPALVGPSSFWLQPLDPWPTPGTGPVGSGLHHAGETVQPSPVTATAGSTAPAPVAAPPTGAGRTGSDAVAPPPAADPWRIRPPGMGGGPRPAAFDPGATLPGPSSQVVSTGTIRPPVIRPPVIGPPVIRPPVIRPPVIRPPVIRPPVMPVGPPRGGQRAEASGFDRAASDAVGSRLARREGFVRRLQLEDEINQATHALFGDDIAAQGWSDRRKLGVLADIHWLLDVAQVHPVSMLVTLDVDWGSIATLMRILDAHPPSP